MDRRARSWVLPGGIPAVVLGRSQRATPVATSLRVRLRASGGGAVLSGPWLLRAAVRLPRTHHLASRGPAALAHWFGNVHLQWLAAQGVSAARLHDGPVRDHWACFGGLGPGEVLAGGRKLTGIAQAWRRSGILVGAGTLLYQPPWALLCEAFARPAGEAVALALASVGAEEIRGRRVDAQSWARGLGAALDSALAQAGRLRNHPQGETA